MSKPNYKKFVLRSKNDYIIYLRQIIIQSHKLMKKHSIYINNLNEEIETLNLIDNPDLKINSAVYEEHNDRIQNVSSKLLNLFGDLQDDSISYYKFRKILVKRNIEVKDILGSLSSEMLELLSLTNQNRNWGQHEPESLLHAHFENIKQLWPKPELDYYLSNFTPIITPMFDKYEGAWLLSLREECLAAQGKNEEIFFQMVRDYEALIGVKLTIKDNLYEVRPFESESLLAKTSFEMQQRKYTGQN